MRQILFLSSAALMLLAVACKGSENNKAAAPATNSSNTTTTPAAPAAPTAQKIAFSAAQEKMVGLWMNKAYLDEVARKRSVRAVELKYKLLGFSLQAAELSAGKNVQLYGFGTHEGGMDAFLKWDEAAGAFLHDLKAYPDNYKFFENEFRLYLASDGTMVIDEQTQSPEAFVKEAKGDIHHAVQRVFFDGVYKDEKGKTITLREGIVTGLPTAEQYALVTDFYPNFDFDAVYMGIGDAVYENPYHYKFTDPTTLELYKVKGNEESGFGIGEKYATWKRQ